MNHIECRFKLNPFYPFNEILIAELGELGFESFVEEADCVLAYISKADFKEEELKEMQINQIEELEISLEIVEIPKENWNKKWEDSFQPVEVDDFCVVRAPFHQLDKTFEHEIIIEPKMSFGTGHHATTQLMLKALQDKSIKGKKVMDMGSGTGILAILAHQLGATEIHAVDIEEWAYENMQENFERNNCPEVKAYLGGAELLSQIDQKFDLFLANINKNILLRDMPAYISHLKEGGKLILSGFFPLDAEEMKSALSAYPLEFINQTDLGDWCCLQLRRLS